MDKPAHHLFVCGSFRANGTPQGNCAKKESLQIVQKLQAEVDERGLEGVSVAMTGCLNCCVKGPVVIDYPAGNWYAGVTSAAVETIMDAIENGEVAEEFLVKG